MILKRINVCFFVLATLLALASCNNSYHLTKSPDMKPVKEKAYVQKTKKSKNNYKKSAKTTPSQTVLVEKQAVDKLKKKVEEVNNPIIVDAVDEKEIVNEVFTAKPKTTVLKEVSVSKSKQWKPSEKKTQPIINDVVDGPSKKVLKQQQRIAKKLSKKAPNNIQEPMDGMAVAGFVLSLVGIFVAGILCGILAIIFSGIALSRFNKGSTKRGKGLALAGLIIGCIVLAATIIYLAVVGV